MRKATEKEKKLALAYVMQWNSTDNWKFLRDECIRNTDDWQRKDRFYTRENAKLNGMRDLLEALNLYFFVEKTDDGKRILRAWTYDMEKKLFELSINFEIEKGWFINS